MSHRTVGTDSRQSLNSEIPTQIRPAKSRVSANLPVIPLMSKKEGERLISQMPKRSLAKALEMKERMLGRL